MRAKYVMDKYSIILKYFQKADLLTVKNPDYRFTLSSLFTWLSKNDSVKHDQTTKLLDLHKRCRAVIQTRESMTVAGLEEVTHLIKKFTKLKIRHSVKDKKTVTSGEKIAEIEGKSLEILSSERTILNILQRMSGIATETNRLVNLMNHQQPTTNQQLFITATRKTPWMSLDKKAVAVGGGLTHRINLSDGILIKDNHLNLVKQKFKFDKQIEAIKKSLEIMIPKSRRKLIEIEVETAAEAWEAVKTFQTLNNNNYLAIMFDNFSSENAYRVVNELRNKFDTTKIIFEASGGINETNLHEWIKSSVDLISIGALTHSSNSANLSLEFIK